MKRCHNLVLLSCVLLWKGVPAWMFSLPSSQNKFDHHRLNSHGSSQDSPISQGSDDIQNHSLNLLTRSTISTRRTHLSQMLASTLGTVGSWSIPPIASSWADDNDNQVPLPTKTIVRGRITIASDIELPPPEESANAALYITARPNTPNNVPRAILDGSNGKPPPVLAARIPFSEMGSSFPYTFALEAPRDLTLEGATKVVVEKKNHAPESSSTTSSDEQQQAYWFEGLDLIVSARWDTDGQAATRSPTDLVGRNTYLVKEQAMNSRSNDNSSNAFTVALTGRGWTGKLVTGGAAKK